MSVQCPGLRLAPVALLLALVACGGGAPGDAANPSAASLPASRGEVWMIDPASPTDAQVLAFLNGVHRFVLKDNEIYTATTRLDTAKVDGALTAATLAGDLQLRIESQGVQPILVFSSGPRGPLRKYEAPEPKP
ncbi:MAG TPA: hypothetical protein PKL49_09545 [Steroidobacteraceae bacterium]|jgi:hypothetical protein|nr:hypothetical protein [Steroidobacteraceae bacterium]HNS26677.1 hypothetical protein [Steroidobacteraceae bacterium]